MHSRPPAYDGTRSTAGAGDGDGLQARAHRRLTVVPPVSIGRPPHKRSAGPIFVAGGACGMLQPMMTSSISAGRPWTRRWRAQRMAARFRKPCVWLKSAAVGSAYPGCGRLKRLRLPHRCLLVGLGCEDGDVYIDGRNPGGNRLFRSGWLSFSHRFLLVEFLWKPAGKSRLPAGWRSPNMCAPASCHRRPPTGSPQSIKQ